MIDFVVLVVGKGPVQVGGDQGDGVENVPEEQELNDARCRPGSGDRPEAGEQRETW